jgi:hypothetical protein
MSTPTAECVNYPFTIAINSLCDWSSVSSIATRTAFDHTYTGTYTNWVANPPLQSSQLKTYIYYNLSGIDILYGVPDSTIPIATAVTQRIHVIGQSGE